jgi:hypothetical protein
MRSYTNLRDVTEQRLVIEVEPDRCALERTINAASVSTGRRSQDMEEVAERLGGREADPVEGRTDVRLGALAPLPGDMLADCAARLAAWARTSGRSTRPRTGSGWRRGWRRGRFRSSSKAILQVIYQPESHYWALLAKRYFVLASAATMLIVTARITAPKR